MKSSITARIIRVIIGSAFIVLPLALSADNASFPTRPLKFGFVNFKNCVEKSKLGKQEQSTFEAMKKQMEGILAEKEKGLNEIASKLSDADFLDSITPEAETEMKRKFRGLSQEVSQTQNQYLQTLQQAQMKILQKITETIAKAAEKVAKDLQLDGVFNEDGAFYYNQDLDISSLVVVEMDAIFEKEQKEAKERPAPTPPTSAPAVPTAPKK